MQGNSSFNDQFIKQCQWNTGTKGLQETFFAAAFFNCDPLKHYLIH